MTRRGVIAGAGLLHPLPLMAVGVLLLNDHVLKRAMPGAFTGKLSDVAGLLFFPLFLQALWEVAQRARGVEARPSLRALGFATFATAVVFSAIQLSPLAGDAYRVGLGALQWAPRALTAALSGEGMPRVAPVALTPDVTDLLALPALLVPLWLGVKRASARPGAVAPAQLRGLAAGR